MSDAPGPGWWQADDGGWHPPRFERDERGVLQHRPEPTFTVTRRSSSTTALLVVLIVVVVGLGIGGLVVFGSGGHSAAGTSSPPASERPLSLEPRRLTIESFSQFVGFGCFHQAAHVGAQLIVKNSAGHIVGQGTFVDDAASQTDACDFKATALLDNTRSDFFTIEIDGSDGNDSRTFSRSRLAGNSWNILIDTSPGVTPS